ncbi:hypothetical protein ABZ752_15335 [Streptomyces roseifaciens]
MTTTEYDNYDEDDTWQQYKDDRTQGLIHEHGNPIDPNPPEDYYDPQDAPDGPAVADWPYSNEPPF